MPIRRATKISFDISMFQRSGTPQTWAHDKNDGAALLGCLLPCSVLFPCLEGNSRVPPTPQYFLKSSFRPARVLLKLRGMSVVPSEARADAAAERLRQSRLRSRSGAIIGGGQSEVSTCKTPWERFEKSVAALKPGRGAKDVLDALRHGRGTPGLPGSDAAALAVTPSPGGVCWSGIPLSVPESKAVASSLKLGVAQKLYRCTSITSLDLSNCGIGPRQAKELQRGLATLSGLQRLNLRGNPLMASGVASIMAGLTKALGGQEDDTGTVLSWAARSSAGALNDMQERLAKYEADKRSIVSAQRARSAVGGSRDSAR